jgi:hypothetical protein
MPNLLRRQVVDGKNRGSALVAFGDPRPRLRAGEGANMLGPWSPAKPVEVVPKLTGGDIRDRIEACLGSFLPISERGRRDTTHGIGMRD